jgi:hypothetical protein
MIPAEYLDVPGLGDCLIRDDMFGSEFPVYEETQRVYPRSDWPALLETHKGLADLVKAIKNQGQEGSCASNAAAQCWEIAWNMTFGTGHWLQLSPISIYRWVSRGPGSGSTISGNLRQLRNVGALPTDTAANRAILRAAGRPENHVLQPTGYYQSFPSGWQQTAAFLQAAEWYDISSFDGFASALFEGFPVCYGRAGHAICGVQVIRRGTTWTIKYANSWGNWGDNGYGYDSESYIASAIRSYGAWALRAPKVTDAFLPAVAL